MPRIVSAVGPAIALVVSVLPGVALASGASPDSASRHHGAHADRAVGTAARSEERQARRHHHKHHHKHRHHHRHSVDLDPAPTALGASYVPCDGVAETSVSPAGNGSVTSAPVAPSGPLFVSVTVNVTVSPTFGVASSTDFAIARSAVAPAFNAAPALLLLGFGST